MSLRKLVSLLLLVTFVASSVTPAMATVTLDAAGLTTLPTLAPDVGTSANGANRDVVPVNLRVNFTSGDITFGKVTGLTALTTINGNLTITANGKLTLANGGTLATPRAVIFTPPSGTKFVKLPIEGYSVPKVQLGNGAAASNTLQSTNIDVRDLTNSNLPGTGNNGNVVIADVLTLDGPNTYFGNTVSAGSLIAYFVTKNEGSDQNTSAGSVVFNGFGLAADSAASPTTSGSATVTYFEPAGSVSEAIPSMSTSNTANIATYGSQAGKVEFLLMGDKTGSETSVSSEPDSQASSVLASLLGTAGTVITAGPGLVTSTTSASSLKLDLDTLILRAAERGDSTSSSRKFYETPFATSAYAGSAVSDNGGTSTLNTALTNSTTFPNTANALMSITFELQDPATGAASTATLKVTAVSVSLLSPRAFEGYRGQIASSVGGSAQTLAGLVGNGGFLGALAFSENGGAADANIGVGVIYNGTSSSSRLVLKDVNPLSYVQQGNQVGLNGRTANVSVPSTGLVPSTIINGTTLRGIFPGSLVTAFDNGTNAITWGKTATAVDNGTGISAFTLSSAFTATAFSNGEPIYTPGEITARLVNTAGGATTETNAWFFVAGSVASGNNTGLGSFQIGPTNTATNLYSKGANAKTAAGEEASATSRNNAIMAARLDGNTLQLLPLVNKYDTIRDAIAIRPELTVTLDSTAKTKGVNIVAKASGGNLSGTTSKTIGRILAAGSITANITLQTVPVGGDSSSLMLEKVTDAGATRSYIALSSVTGASSSTDEIDDLNGTTTALDTTIPPLFCGGAVGDGTRGPNGVVFQPKARAILIKENGTDAFKNLQDLGSNTVIRVTLPTGVDINAYNGSLVDSQILGVIATGGSTFSVAPSLVRVQPISKNNGSTLSGAFVDVSLGTSGTPTQTATRRIIGLVFKPNALVVPAGTTNLNATISIVNTGGTSTRDGAINDDIVLTTLGTAALSDACSTFLTLQYCDSGLSTYQKSGSTEVLSEMVANGASLTSFAASPSTAVRLVGNTADDVVLPDLCIAEGIADALPIGQGVDGVPNAFGVASVTTNGTGVLHIASTFNGTASVGLKVGSSTNVFFSDSSLNNGSALANVNQNEVGVTIQEGSASTRHRPFIDKSTIRLRGLQMRKAASSSTVVPAQSFIAWFEAVSSDGSRVVGSNNPQAFNVDTNNGVTALVNADKGAAETNGMIAHFRNGNGLSALFAGTVTASNFADSSTSATTNTLTVVTTKAQPITLSNAVTTIFDNASFTTLIEGETQFTVSTSAITGSTDKSVEVSVKAGTLEPGSVVTLTATGTGSQDSVTVPVLDDGSFKATLRASTSQTITVVQVPDSQQSSVPVQVASLAVADQNVAPVLDAATFVDIGMGDITAKGTVPVVFEVSASGKLNGADYVPVASELTLGGQPVTAVSGSTTQFIGVVSFSADNNLTVTSTAGDDSSVELSGFTTTAATKTGKPKLTKASVNTAGTLILKGTNLGNAGTAGFVLDDATFTSISLAPRSKKDKEKSRRRALSTSIPTNAVYVIFSVDGKGVSALEL